MAPKFLTRSLNAVAFDDFRVLDTLRWPTPFGTSVRMYLAAGGAGDITSDAGSQFQIKQTQWIGKNTIVTGEAPEGTGPVSLRLSDAELMIQTCTPETRLFDDLDVILGQRHAETPDVVAEWLAYHGETHGATGALIVDRAPPEDGFAKALKPLVKGLGYARILIVIAPIPLGKPDRPAIYSRARAPRSQDRSGPPDQWRAPLAEMVLFDALRWRFLSQAGCVLALDPVDFLDPTAEGIAAFDTCRQSQNGVMPILGEPVFPWRVRKGQAATRHDHICRIEPRQHLESRWAVAPKRIGPNAVWLPQAIFGAEPMADETLSYRRAMSLAFADVPVAELVKKDLLVLDQILFEATQAAGHKPVPPPAQPKQAAQIALAQPTGRTVAVTCMKNEGPFILEWIAYHRMIGVDDFLVYTNDCDDGTVELLDLLAQRGVLTRRDNPFPETGNKPQQSALAAAQDEAVVRDAGWIISMDVDEFINVHIGGNRLPDLYAAIGDASLVSLTWRLFGNDDVVAFQDRPVTEQFTRCAPQLIRRPHQAWGFKTLFRNQGLFKGIGVHRPRGHLGGPARWVNGSGQAMPDRLFKTGWRSDVQTYGYDWVTLNHYSVRSVESFLVKRDRGRVNHVARDQGEGYWFRMNNNDEQDLSIQVHAHGLRRAIDDFLNDDEVKAAHDHCIAAHRAKIKRLRTQPDYAQLHQRLSSDRMQKLSRMHRHFGMNVFLNGPSCIPDSVFGPDQPSNFFFNVAPPQGKLAE